MLWSISNGKSGTTWLDRLRTAKGFPENGVTDLDQFLQNPNSPTPETPDPQTNSVGIPDPAQTGNEQLFDIMTDVLHDLFNFGDKCSNPNKIKKSARKQANPRICALSGNGSHESNAAPGKAANVTLLRSTDSNCRAEGMKELDKWENEGDGNLTGFSRTEVTVIDTSYESWKFDKLLYRKKNVWKVRDKKGKSEVAGSKKKRKTSVAMEEDQRAVKKLKVDDDKEGSAEEGELPLTEISKPEVHEKASNSNKVCGILKKKRTDLNLENGNTSVIVIKSIHTNKKNGTSISKSCIKSKQKKT